MKTTLLFALCAFIFTPAFAVTNQMTVSGRLLQPDGTAVSSSSITFDISVLGPTATCVLYREQFSADLSSSNGLFEFGLGSGTASFGTSLSQVFDSTNGTLPCEDSTSYAPAAGDTLALQIKFYDATQTSPTWRTFTSSVPVRSVPQAMHAAKAEKLGNNIASDFLLKPTGTCSAGHFVSYDGSTAGCSSLSASNISSGSFSDSFLAGLSIDKLINSTGKYFDYKPNGTACAPGEILQYTPGTGWICGTQSAAGVSSLSVSTPLQNSGTATAVSLEILQATSSQSGFLTSSDWTTFNSKQSSNSELTGISNLISTGILQRTGAGTYATLGVSAPLIVSTGNLGIADISAALITSGTLDSSVLPSEVLMNGGNSTAATLVMGTTGSQNMSLITSGTSRMAIDSEGTVSLAGTLLMPPAVANGSATINFKNGNLQFTTSSCSAYVLHNMKNGGSYTFAVQGTTSATCSFTAYVDEGSTPLTVHMPPDHNTTTSGKHTLYTFLVMGGHVYASWMPGL